MGTGNRTMIDEETLILRWINTMLKEGIKTVDTDTYLALRYAIREYNLYEKDEQPEPDNG